MDGRSGTSLANVGIARRDTACTASQLIVAAAVTRIRLNCHSGTETRLIWRPFECILGKVDNM